MDILVIGAGKASVAILNEFAEVDAHRVAAVADLDTDAVGMREAQKRNIPVYTDFKQMIHAHRYDAIFELTGVRKIFEQAKQESDSEDKVIPASAMRVVYDLIESFKSRNAQKAGAANQISDEFASLGSDLDSTHELISHSSEQIRDLLEEARFISINARIQSQKAGSYGKTFVPIVDKFSTLIGEIQDVLENIDKSGDKARIVSENITESEQKIKALF